MLFAVIHSCNPINLIKPGGRGSPLPPGLIGLKECITAKSIYILDSTKEDHFKGLRSMNLRERGIMDEKTKAKKEGVISHEKKILK